MNNTEQPSPLCASDDLRGRLVISVARTARLLGVNRSTLRRMNQDGRLPYPINLTKKRVGYLVSEISAWLAARAASRSGEPGETP
jgi:predicted DNA-binding transcriptional regulator AlpA